MPQILFENDADFALGNRFVIEALNRGAYLHPWHNMFLSAAHSEADIDEVLEATTGAFQAMRERP
jgi:glutamate-1-semialdehyde 2,1-aminomutase